ncbi:putative Flp pilus-assembly TadE/G-like protein [Hephaestia caeni]|uniref:Putative Flp pilus-assembly TadE/G-like protein n=1 Tax=Hephaestia caeni TaxID=645617 RepID=A0A397NSM8_9SPHN|nr:pilus assembly protein TadG-related protein [Hephaestia caeni]RIA36684.1 putative Flp pilus-assembly TadE/G-like protein [Hephaestia caeni]
MISRFSAFLARLRASQRGNVLMLFGFAMIPMVFATGMGIDYARAARLRTKLNALADAAALSAVTQTMMEEEDEGKVKAAATVMFKAQADTLGGMVGTPEFHIELSHPDGANSRTADVTYTAKSLNSFGGVLKMHAITVAGSSTASAARPPDMDFYIALDTSPSMALPTTSAGIEHMDEKMNCSFACHSNKIQQYIGSGIGKLPSLILDNAKFSIIKGAYRSSGSGSNKKQYIDDDNSYIYVNRDATDSKCKTSSSNKDICVYNADGTYADSYWYARNQNINLRVTDERTAVQDLMTLAQSYAESNHRDYRAALYTFDHSTNLKTIASLTSNLANVSTLANNVDLVTVNDQMGNGRPPDGSSGQEYLFTSFKSILKKMENDVLPATSGKGTDEPGDTPQAFLFMVTDGMSDENIGSGRTRDAMQQQQIDQCNAIKNRGIKIAILYTEYTVESIKDDEPGQRAIAEKAIPKIAPALNKCASPNLMMTVKTDESISDALRTLFTKAIASAHLIK